MTISFHMDYRTTWGQRLYVCGSLPELGNGDPALAPALNHSPGGKWEITLKVAVLPTEGFDYQYFVRYDNDIHAQWEAGRRRPFALHGQRPTAVTLFDAWRAANPAEAALFSSAFTDVLLRPQTAGVRKPAPPRRGTSPVFPTTRRFQIRVPRVGRDYRVCLVGSDPALGNWDASRAILLDDSEYPLLKADVVLTNPELLRYKYGIYDPKTQSVRTWEAGDDRTLWLDPSPAGGILYVHTDEGFRYPMGNWRGAGVAIPVFSLRSQRGTGVGEFLDLPLLTDWAVRTGHCLLQLLPIHDTVATHDWADSYPYAAISVYALHPMYLNLAAMGTLQSKEARTFYEKKQRELNALPAVDYPAVMAVKSRYFKELYDQEANTFLKSADFKAFLEENRHWLMPYAAFSYLRDLYGTPDFTRWGAHATCSPALLAQLTNPARPDYADVAVHYFIQFHLDRQLTQAREYAQRHGVVLKGDLPIGIYRNSVDAWTQPELFHMDAQAGAPPDDFSATGQNWRFPTYNWERMRADGYAWWKARLTRMARYFDVYRIDHILGFFRIWEIPADGVDGLLGHFNPALPFSRQELLQRGFGFDYERFCQPYIRNQALIDHFGEYRDEVVSKYLDEYAPGQFRLREAVRTQQQVDVLLVLTTELSEAERQKRVRLRNGLFALIAEVLFLEAPATNGQAFNPRITFHSTYSYRALDGWQKQRLNELYVDYFYKRHEQFWRNEGMEKLPAVKNATNMLVCGEDLGMVPDVVPGVMQELGLLSLCVQRMPNNPQTEFGHPNDAPYLSVVTPSSHDTSTVRGWWEEDRDRTQRFFNQLLGKTGPAPHFCEPWVAREIVVQHLYSPAMWAIFPLQDLLAMDDKLRRPDPQEERINVPAEPNHHWQYRLHLDLETLREATDFNASLLALNTAAGRHAPY